MGGIWHWPGCLQSLPLAQVPVGGLIAPMLKAGMISGQAAAKVAAPAPASWSAPGSVLLLCWGQDTASTNSPCAECSCSWGGCSHCWATLGSPRTRALGDALPHRPDNRGRSGPGGQLLPKAESTYGAVLPAQDTSVLGKPLSLLPQGAQDTCALSVLLQGCPVPEVSPSVILLPCASS